MKIIKGKLIVSIAFVFAVAVIGFVVVNWLRNPYGLEVERLVPKSIELPQPIVAVPNAQNYLLFTYAGESNYVIHLALPNQYIHKSRETKRFIESYSISAYMYYPELNGKFHPENANLPKCNGWCEGYVSAFIEPSNSSAKAMNEKALELNSIEASKENSRIKIEHLYPEFGITDHYQIKYPVAEEKSNGGKASTKEYFVKKNNEGESEYVFECHPYVPSPSCSVKFNLTSRPELLVNITFGRHLMAEWEKLINSINTKIGSWGATRIEAISN